MNQPGTDADIKRAFDSVDIDGSGLVEWDEFIFSIMGENALNYGLLADIEQLSELLNGFAGEFSSIQSDLQANIKLREERAAEAELLRKKLKNVKADIQDEVKGMFARMMNINPEDVLSDEEIEQHLTQAFEKFDEDRSGQLGVWEFKQAWVVPSEFLYIETLLKFG